MLMNLLPTAEAIDDRVQARPAFQPHLRRRAYRSWPRVIGAWIERSRQRRALADLDNRLLGDVGITRSQAGREIAKPFWR